MKVLKSGLLLVIIVLSWFIYRSIRGPIEYQQEKKKRYDQVIQHLKDIRSAQIAFKAERGNYTSNFDTLIDFIRTGKFTLVRQIGNPDDSNAVVIRDTFYVNVRDSLFPKEYLIDSLPYIPFTDKRKFAMQAGEIEKGTVKVKVFEVADTDPFDKADVLRVGSMTEPTNAGNWE